MKNFSKTLAILWSIVALLNFIACFVNGFDFDKGIIAMMALLLANFNYKDYVRGE